jgi:hypothetical protein
MQKFKINRFIFRISIVSSKITREIAKERKEKEM